MTDRELVIAAIAHQPTPRVPHFVSFTRQWMARFSEGKTRYEYAKNCVYTLACPWWGYDAARMPPNYAGEATPTVLPAAKGTGSYEAFYEELERARAETDSYILVCIYGSHFEKAYFARGIENFLADMAAEPEYAQRLLDWIIEKNMVMLDNILSRPEIDGVLLGSDWGSQKSLLMSPEIWRRMIRGGEQREYDLIHAAGKHVWVHSCGNIEAILPDLVEMGVDVLNPLQPECNDIQRVKRLYGDKMTFWGGISTQHTLPYGTPDEVRAEARRVVELMSQGGGYIAAPSQEIQEDVPIENVRALLETIGRG